MIDIGSAVSEGKVAVIAAGALIVGVVVAIRAIDWLKLVIIEREAAWEARKDEEWRWGGD